MKNEKIIKKLFHFLIIFYAALFILFSCDNYFMQDLLPVTKIQGAAVTQPVVAGIPAPNSITVQDVGFIDNPGKQIAEYAISQTNDAPAESLSWQTGTSFSDLYTATTYYVYARSAENTSCLAGSYNVSDPIRFYTVSFHANGATGGTHPAIQTAFQNESIILPTRSNLTKTDFTFGCWNTQSDSSGENYIPGHLYQVTGNQILYAKWVAEQTYIFPFLQPESNTPVVSGITISQTGADSYPITGNLELSNPGNYSLIEWFYGSIKLGEGAGLELNAADIRYNIAGTHSIAVVVWQNGMPYSLRISFVIVK